MSFAHAVREPVQDPFCVLFPQAGSPFSRTRLAEALPNTMTIPNGAVVLGQYLYDWAAWPRGGGIERANYVLDEKDFEYLNAVYQTDQPFVVKDYLKKHPFVMRLLIDAYPRLRLHFGPQAAVVLQLVEEPEAAKSNELFAVVRTSMPVEQAMSAQEAFDVAWWFDAARQAKGRLNFTTEYL